MAVYQGLIKTNAPEPLTNFRHTVYPVKFGGSLRSFHKIFFSSQRLTGVAEKTGITKALCLSRARGCRRRSPASLGRLWSGDTVAITRGNINRISNMRDTNVD